MSLYDISRLSGTGAARALGRDLSSSGKAETRPAGTPAPAPAPADRGIAVETGSRVSAGAAPLDADRVAQIRDALKEGSYPIVPAKITDAVIAARLMLSSGQ